jgi:hypothetical protein
MKQYLTISESLVPYPQGWNYVKVVKANKNFRVEIRVDAYDFQSYARVKAWDGSKWEFVHSIPFEHCQISKVNAYQKNVEPKPFQSDADTLISIARQIVE